MTQYNILCGGRAAGKTAMTETQLQARCYQWAHNTYPQLRKLLFAVPNGGTRHVREAMTLKATGVVAGVPDMICLYGGRVTGIEMKAENGVLSKEQKEVHQAWRSAGIEVHVCYSEEQFQSLIRTVLNITIY